MSATAQVVMDRARYHLRDRDKGREAFSPFEYLATCDSEMKILAGAIDLGDSWYLRTDGDALAISGTSDEWTLPLSPDPATIKRVRLYSTQRELRVVSVDEFASIVDGNPTPSTSPGDPTVCCMWEDYSQVVHIRVHPWPRGADWLEFYRSDLPTSLTSSGDIIPFDDGCIEALALAVAETLALKMPAEERARRGLDPGVVQKWRPGIVELVRAHRVRRARQKSRKRIRRGVRGY